MINKRSLPGLGHFSLILALLNLTSCVSNVQPTVSQFGNAITTAQSAEIAFLGALNQKQANYDNVRFLGSKALKIQEDGSVTVSHDSATLPTSPVPPSAVAAINDLLTPLQAYGQAMQALSGDTAATTFDTNVTNLATQSQAFDASVLTPLTKTGALTTAQVNAVATAIQDIGNIVIASLISNDVQKAAQQAQPNLQKIISVIEIINEVWSANVSNNLSSFTIGGAVTIWNDPRNPPSYDERVALLGIISDAEKPVTSDAANKALVSLLATNSEISSAGPVSAQTQIESFTKAANAAYTAYKSLGQK